ncbi:HPr family phosphocarrier protein [Paraferrimonas sp. SM1919]|uniref:HPr family phosphocarrier protein n=1 Tax=Paraferrimonas sp. SM1919 TaxID=2662263 RepID=UPI0013D1449C|nr:HPr family phosphocarrier protein [Paraferrimonas sp. SM1919]
MSQWVREIMITNKLGIHTRPATLLAKLAIQFDARITIQQGEKSANAASVLGLLMLESSMGKNITISACGHDAEAALDAICQLIQSGFDEV